MHETSNIVPNANHPLRNSSTLHVSPEEISPVSEHEGWSSEHYRERFSTLIPSSLRRNFSWTFIGNAIYAACQWGVVVMLAKMGNPEMVGQFSLALAIATPVIILTNLQLRAVQATDTDHEYLFRDYFSLRVTTVAFALIIIVTIAVLGSFRLETSLVIIAIGIGKSCDAIVDIYFGMFQQAERMAPIARALTVNGILSLFATICGLLLTDHIIVSALGWSLASAVTLIFLHIRFGVFHLNSSLGRTEDPRKRFAVWRSLIQSYNNPKLLIRLSRLSLPLGITTMLIAFNASIPRYILGHELGEHDLGLFAAIAYFVMMGGVVISALGQAATPRLAKYHAMGKKDQFRDLLTRLSAIVTVIGIIGALISIFLGGKLLSLVYSSEYAVHANVFVLMMSGACFGYVGSILGCAVTAQRRFSQAVFPYLLTTMVTIFACLILIPAFGIIGAAVSVAVTGLTSTLAPLSILILRSRERERHELPS